ncbi:autotransporter domain-containing protein [Aerophototrophica crusticola]|uniref:Autotransporter domain-containing protein n=1 Tax=Aerophototrophica crusticola TaxID=1709002 RepID=A0A858R9G1_9PROT|nr:autotransporter domain-containing protein [Rhodospirillaceae bacterium B3]
MDKITQGRGRLAAKLLGCASATAMAAGLLASVPANALVTPETRPANAASTVDGTNTRPYWVGLGIRNVAGNGGSTCTGLLINPRTVLFAAHCVDDTAMNQYNAAGSRASVAYTMDPTFGIGNLRQWLFGNQANGQPQPGSDGRTMTSESVNVFFHPEALKNASNAGDGLAFLSADIAMAAFGTATDLGRNNANTIGLLFSPVTGPVPVVLGGYGQSGNGLTGARQSDFRRRLGTNIMGFLGSDRDVTLGVYGPTLIADLFDPPGDSYQDMYWVDFDDPLRGTRSPGYPFDFNAIDDAPTALEASTAPGDSGSPLVTNAYGRDVSIGVLSQGTRFFFGQNTDPFFVAPPQANYGTLAGYNPLFLFWDFIVANNPYKYVSVASTAATVEWSDASAWRQDMDPNYFILQNGQLVNGLPTTPALGVSTAATNVGKVNPNPNPLPLCAFFGDCTGPTAGPAGDTTALPGLLSADDMAEKVAIGDTLVDKIATGTDLVDKIATAALPPASEPTAAWTKPAGSEPASGPGTVGNFRPNNQNGASGVFNSARYFEVTLNRAGQTVNLSANNVFTNNTVTIDRLNLSGATTTLNIASGARLNTELGSYLDAGTLNVSGTFAPRALDMLGGRLQGTGTVLATGGIRNSGGVISGGVTDAAGTLAITGPVTISGTGALGIDIVSATSADRVNVTGALTLGGMGMVNAVGSYVPAWNTSWVVASGTTVTGNFGGVASNLPGVLVPVFTTANNQVTLRIDARPFSTAVALNSTAQRSFAGALDAGRAANYTALKPLYDSLDPLPAAQAREALDRLNPDDAYLARKVSQAQVGFMSSAIADRMATARAGGQGVTMAGLAPSLFSGNGPSQLLAMNPVETQIAQDTAEKVADLKPGYGLFLNVRRLDGDTTSPTGLDGDLQNTLATVGLDKMLNDNILVGAALSYAWGDSDVAGNVAESDVKTYAASLYASFSNNGFFVDGYGSVGNVDTDTTRRVLGFTLEGETDGKLFSAGLGVGYDLKAGSFGVVPELRYDYASVDYDGYDETGGAAALRIGSRMVQSAQLRMGSTFYGEFKLGEQSSVIPKLTLFRASESRTGGEAVSNATFVNGNGVPVVGGPVPKRDKSWFEVGGGLTVKVNPTTEVSLSYEATTDRSDLDTKAYMGSVRIRF